MRRPRIYRFIGHVACFGLVTATMFGALGVPELGYREWFFVNAAISAAWWPVFDLATGREN